MVGVCSVGPDFAKQMMINEAVGGRLPALFAEWRATHKSFLSNYLSLTISAGHSYSVPPSVPSPALCTISHWSPITVNLHLTSPIGCL